MTLIESGHSPACINVQFSMKFSENFEFDSVRNFFDDSVYLSCGHSNNNLY